MGAVIDSSLLIQVERTGFTGPSVFDSREDFFVSVITASELLHGVHRALDAGVRARRSAWVNALLNVVPILDIDLAIARMHAELWADLSARGIWWDRMICGSRQRRWPGDCVCSPSKSGNSNGFLVLRLSAGCRRDPAQ